MQSTIHFPPGDKHPTVLFSPENHKNTPLHFSSFVGNAGEVEKLLDLGSCEIEAKNYQKKTALDLAAGKGHTVVVRKLLAAGAEVDTRDEMEKTPLHTAACWGHADVVEILLAAGADKEAKERERNFTPLIYAAGNDHRTVVQVLLTAGANTQAWTTDPCTALHLACGDGHEEVVKQLIAAGANIHASRDGVMPLHCAAKGGQGGVVQILLAAGADLDPRCGTCATPSELAGMAGHLQIVAMIREEKRRRATLKACEVCGTQTSLRCACKKVAFCKRDCMKKGWKTHKQSCRGKNKSSKPTA